MAPTDEDQGAHLPAGSQPAGIDMAGSAHSDEGHEGAAAGNGADGLPGTPSGVEQRVTWLELFFDLIFVVAFDQLSRRLGDGHSPENLAVFGLYFVAIWWAWAANATYAARYGNEARAYRWSTLAEVVAVGLIALTLRGELSLVGAFFGVAYGLSRWLHAARHLWTARQSPAPLSYSRRVAVANAFTGALWMVSALMPGGSGLQFALWCVALLLDVLTPILIREAGEQALPHEGHLPERVGLLQIIALGAVVNDIVSGGRQQALSWGTLWPALLSMVVTVGLWRLYFDQARALPLIAARQRGSQALLLLWLYGHLPLTLALVVLGVGLGHGLSSADSHEVAFQGQLVRWSLVLALLSLGLLRALALRVARLPPLDRTVGVLGGAALVLVALAFMDLGASWLDLEVAVVVSVAALLVATDPGTRRLGRIESKVTERLEAQARQGDQDD